MGGPTVGAAAGGGPDQAVCALTALGTRRSPKVVRGQSSVEENNQNLIRKLMLEIEKW